MVSIAATSDRPYPKHMMSHILKGGLLGSRREAYLLWGDRLLRCLMQFLDSFLVIPQILLAANEDYRKTLAEMKDLGDPL